MYSILSDDGNWIVVFHDDDEEEEPEELTLQEYIERYGDDALPAREMKPEEVLREDLMPHEPGDVQQYWASFRRLCKACGKHSWADKLERNCAEGVFMAQKVQYDTFGPSDAPTKLAITVASYDRKQYACINNLDYWSQRVGFKPMSARDKDVLIEHLNNGAFRSRMYYRIDKYARRNELYSARDLVIEVLRSFQVN